MSNSVERSIREPSVPPRASRKDASTSISKPAVGNGQAPVDVRPWLEKGDKLILALSTFLKISLWPAYHSTDFEVHRNWLAITHSLPLRDWYFEATSQWTLDYPPFFAYFSWILAQPAPLVDPLIVALHQGLEHSASPAKYYMRATVMVTELVLGAALLKLSRPEKGTQAEGLEDSEKRSERRLLAAAIFLHPGLIIIDHIHFQYNGFLFGVLFWSLWAAREVSNGVQSCFITQY